MGSVMGLIMGSVMESIMGSIIRSFTRLVMGLVMRSVSSCHAVSRITWSSEIAMNRTLGCFCGRFQASLPLSFTARGEEWQDSRPERGENGDDDYYHHAS